MALGSTYHDWIIETGKQPELFLLLALLGSFAFIRTSAHLWTSFRPSVQATAR
jgi:hypothetical protein